MLKSALKTTLIIAIAFLFTACNNYKQAMKVMPNQIKQANQCISKDEDYESNCYDLISYKNSVALIRLGIKSYSQGEYEKAFRLYTQAKQNENFYANALLSELYLKGRGVKKNQKKALQLLQETKNVDPIASYKLSYYHIKKKNYKTAIKLLEFAAKNSVKPAQLKLSEIYANGVYAQANMEKSIFWMQKYESDNKGFMYKIYGI
ncbi:MAG: tetratricopeptide repeat protein [Campylobacterota bacterium]